jgi:hypothetical protein
MQAFVQLHIVARRYGHRERPMARLSVHLSSTLEELFDYDGQHQLGGPPAFNQPIAMQIIDEEDSTTQPNQAILSMHGQEQATDDVEQGRGRLDESYATGSVGVQTSSDNHIKPPVSRHIVQKMSHHGQLNYHRSTIKDAAPVQKKWTLSHT